MIFFITKKIITDFILFPSAEILLRSKKLSDTSSPSDSGLVSGAHRSRSDRVSKLILKNLTGVDIPCILTSEFSLLVSDVITLKYIVITP